MLLLLPPIYFLTNLIDATAAPAVRGGGVAANFVVVVAVSFFYQIMIHQMYALD